ncbi:hypothetical protein YC2023_115188 [Brassica napus]
MGPIRLFHVYGVKPGPVSAQGLGCLGLSSFHGDPARETDAITLLHHAVDSGVTFFDTSDIYGPETNEFILSRVPFDHDGVREKVELATKFGFTYGEGKREIKGDPLYVRAACEASLKRLDVDCIDLYYQHRIDTRVPIEITVSIQVLSGNGSYRAHSTSRGTGVSCSQ